MKSFNWRHFRRDLKQVLTQAVEDWLAAHTNKSAHAVALYGFYAETDGPIHLPMLGLREHAILPSPDPLASWWEEWSPYEWPEPCQEVALDEQARKTLEHSLTLHACSGDVAHWRDVHVLYIQSINKVLNALRTHEPTRRCSPTSLAGTTAGNMPPTRSPRRPLAHTLDMSPKTPDLRARSMRRGWPF